jgi:hypothetical protein
MAKRVKRKRKRAQRNTNDDGLTALHGDIARHLAQWRGLKVEFDRVHRAGLGALRRHQFDRLSAIILREHRLIEKQSALIQEARARLTNDTVILRKP